MVTKETIKILRLKRKHLKWQKSIILMNKIKTYHDAETFDYIDCQIKAIERTLNQHIIDNLLSGINTV